MSRSHYLPSRSESRGADQSQPDGAQTPDSNEPAQTRPRTHLESSRQLCKSWSLHREKTSPRSGFRSTPERFGGKSYFVSPTSTTVYQAVGLQSDPVGEGRRSADVACHRVELVVGADRCEVGKPVAEPEESDDRCDIPHIVAGQSELEQGV